MSTPPLMEISKLAAVSTYLHQTSGNLKRVDLTRAFASYILSADTCDSLSTLLKMDSVNGVSDSHVYLSKPSVYLISVQITASVHNTVDLADMLYVTAVYMVDSINKTILLQNTESLVGADLSLCHTKVEFNTDYTGVLLRVCGVENTKLLWRCRCVVQHIGR